MPVNFLSQPQIGNALLMPAADKKNPLSDGIDNPTFGLEGARPYSGGMNEYLGRLGRYRDPPMPPEAAAKQMLEGSQGNYENAIQMATNRGSEDVANVLRAWQAAGITVKGIPDPMPMAPPATPDSDFPPETGSLRDSFTFARAKRQK